MKISLSKTNQYLKNDRLREELNKLAVKTTFAVEGIAVNDSPSETKLLRRKKQLFDKLRLKLS